MSCQAAPRTDGKKTTGSSGAVGPALPHAHRLRREQRSSTFHPDGRGGRPGSEAHDCRHASPRINDAPILSQGGSQLPEEGRATSTTPLTCFLASDG